MTTDEQIEHITATNRSFLMVDAQMRNLTKQKNGRIVANRYQQT